MVQDDPDKRPDMDAVVASFQKIRKGLSSSKLDARLVKRSESGVQTVVKDIGHNVGSIFRRPLFWLGKATAGSG
jgi:hypothetical protein